MTVGANQVARDCGGKSVEAVRSEARPPHVGAGEVRAGQRGRAEVRVAEVLAGEVTTSKIVVNQVDAAQVVRLVAGRGIELGKRDSGCVKVRSPYDGAGEVNVRQRGAIEDRIGQILADE